MGSFGGAELPEFSMSWSVKMASFGESRRRWLNHNARENRDDVAEVESALLKIAKDVLAIIVRQESGCNFANGVQAHAFLHFVLQSIGRDVDGSQGDGARRG